MASLHEILLSHFTRTPAMQPRDVYKLLHQAAMGSEHAVDDEQSARIWLAREISEMGAGPAEPMLDPISPDGQILRVHLRPYIQAGKDPQALLHAFICTANEWRGSVVSLKAYGAEATLLLKAGTGSFPPQDFENFFTSMADQGFPAAHHSEEYTRLYRPAYRVVARQFLEVL